ncbi:hypothetical protein EVAR_20790_1 [Eumeta japonica]|uniref:Secreted protein n=1 Tax=Eumeta variegata TaxID=151549 RepID=A0A4C1UEU6_EUMVA|nr:hypothetical protein EVAR_20790_1 [Eumeta japonica]
MWIIYIFLKLNKLSVLAHVCGAALSWCQRKCLTRDFGRLSHQADNTAKNSAIYPVAFLLNWSLGTAPISNNAYGETATSLLHSRRRRIGAVFRSGGFVARCFWRQNAEGRRNSITDRFEGDRVWLTQHVLFTAFQSDFMSVFCAVETA